MIICYIAVIRNYRTHLRAFLLAVSSTWNGLPLASSHDWLLFVSLVSCMSSWQFNLRSHPGLQLILCITYVPFFWFSVYRLFPSKFSFMRIGSLSVSVTTPFVTFRIVSTVYQYLSNVGFREPSEGLGSKSYRKFLDTHKGATIHMLSLSLAIARAICYHRKPLAPSLHFDCLSLFPPHREKLRKCESGVNIAPQVNFGIRMVHTTSKRFGVLKE